jgi:hypothetical protein
MNQVIIDKSCTMSNSSGLGMKFWPDAIYIAIFVANNLWHYSSKGIAYDKFTGCPVNISMLCVVLGLKASSIFNRPLKI